MSNTIYALALPFSNSNTKIPFCGRVLGGSHDMHLLEHPQSGESYWCLKTDCWEFKEQVLINDNQISKDYKYITLEDDFKITVIVTELKSSREKHFTYNKPKYDTQTIFQIFNSHSDETFKEMFPKERKPKA